MCAWSTKCSSGREIRNQASKTRCQTARSGCGSSAGQSRTSREEIERLEDTARSERDKLIIRVFGDTGMRVGELVRLRTDDHRSCVRAKTSCMCGGRAISTGWCRSSSQRFGEGFNALYVAGRGSQ
jgi:hypothetical protein